MNYKEKIKELGINISKVAEILEISNTMMSFYLNGTRPIPEEKEKKLKRIIFEYSKVKI